MASNRVFHDLQTTSGLGDRLLDTCAVLTVLQLTRPDGKLQLRWSDPPIEGSFPRSYVTDLVRMDNAEFVAELPSGAAHLNKFFEFDVTNRLAFSALTDNAEQMFLRRGQAWGTNTPERLWSERGFYGFAPGIRFDDVLHVYRTIMRTIEPGPQVVEAIPENLGSRVGIHVRLTDKLVNKARNHEMSLRTWKAIERKGMACIDGCIDAGEAMFICSDDAQYRQNLLAYISSRGGDAIAADLPDAGTRPAGFDAAVDLFALSRCKRIIQMTSYSTFSIAAALIGNCPLVNLRNSIAPMRHHLKLWRKTLPDLRSARQELGTGRFLMTSMGMGRHQGKP